MKTLGVKFQVVGVAEAQEQLNKLRVGINKTLGQNKKAVDNYQKAVKRDWQEWKIENFGSTSQKQNLVIRQERRNFSKRSTYKQLNTSNRALVLEFRLAYKDFFQRLEKLLDDKQNPNIFEKFLGVLGKPINFAFEAILFPFQSALAGAFERMGEVQVQDFAEGFNKKLQRALGLSFEETGGDIGNMLGKSLYKVYEKSLESVDKYVKGTLQFNLADTLIDAFKYTTKQLAKELPALALRTHRRIQINKNAIPQARTAAGLAMIENKLPEATVKDIEANKSISLIYGGANTDSADIGKDYTARVMKPYLKGSAVIPLTRQWTNSAVDSEFQGDVKNLIKLILSNPMAAQTFKGFVAENGLDSLAGVEQKELMEGLDLEGEIDLSSLDRIAELIQSLMSNKDFALGKALQATFKGYNPDDVLGAAEAIAIMEQFPDKDLQIGGFSHGGYNALGTVDLLNRMGYTNVKGFSIGTPITGANATVNPDNFKAFMGDKDYYYKALTGLAGDEIDFPEFFSLGKKEGSLHSLQGYVRGDNLKGGLQEFLKGRVDIPSKDNYGKHDSAYGYAAGELGAETALVRTLLNYLGESKLGAVNAKEGFIFSAEESLPGYVGNLKKLGRGLKDEDTKKFHTEYIDFLETLQEELEIAEKLAAIGKQYKPIESLQKAAKIFPQMETMAAKHTTTGMSEEQLNQAQQEAAEKEKLVFFKRKVAQQKDNIERTFQAMLGRKFTKKDEQKGIYSFYNEEEYAERAGNFEGMVNWLENDVLAGASPEEMNEAQPTIDLLKKITQSIRETGSTGKLDLETVRQAEKLLGIDIKEFNALFKKFEAEDKKKVDVRKYKQELRTFRRNRDQILNERALPPDVQESLKSVEDKFNTVDVDSVEDIVLDTQQLQEAFSEYLEEIIRKGTEYGTEILRENAANIDGDNFNEAEITQQFANLNAEFKAATKQYRQAVADGNSQLSLELAENLLFQSASLKRIYAELVEKIQDPDTSRSIRGFSGYLTSVQTEIARGQPNAIGRVATGLSAQIADNPELEARVREIDFGTDIRAGIEKIINRETGEEIGYQFVLGINEGGQDAADINSPSKVWEWMGQMIKAGLDNGVAGIGEFLAESVQEASDAASEALSGIPDMVAEVAGELNDTGGLLDPLLETEGADEEINNFFGGLIEKVSEVFDDLVEKYPLLGRVVDFLQEIGGEVLQVLGIFSFGEALIQFSTDALAAAMQLESLERSIIAVSNSAVDGANNIRFIREEARKLSIDLISAEESYKRILGATRNTPLEGLQTQQIFSTIATTAKNRGLTTDATNRLFLGFEQVIAKNEFKSEEVRGQLAEVLGDIQNLLATSVGVPLSQLGELMETGSLKAPEVMPKLLATLNAQNAALGTSAGTAATAQIRLNNAILEYQDAVGRTIQPIQKMGLNSLAAALEALQGKASILIKLANSLIATVLVNLTLRFLSIKLAVNGLTLALGKLLGLLLSAPFLKFARRFLLIATAIEVWSNNIKLLKNSFPELEDRLEASRKRLDALKKAFDDTGEAAKNYGNNQPKQLQLNEGPQVPEWAQGIAGGDRLNFDNLLRNRLQRFQRWIMNTTADVYDKAGFPEDATELRKQAAAGRGTVTTGAQKKQADFVVGASDLLSQSNQTLNYSSQARAVLDQIAELDAKARDLQSQRLSILPGDVQGLKDALAKEKAVLEERDELLAKSSQYQESLRGDIQDIKDSLLELDELDKTGGTAEEIAQRKNTRDALVERLKLLEEEEKAIDEINSKIPKFLSQIARLLRNTSERVSGFIANQEDDAVGNRTEAISEAIAQGLSDADLEIKLDNLAATDFEDRINFIQKEIANLEDKLGSAYLQEGVAGLERAAEAEGLELTPATLERMLEEGRSGQETEAANILLALDEYEGILAQAESGLVDLIRTSHSKLTQFNRTISDYFSRLTQQIKEAQIESQRLLSQILYTDIKNKLQGALAPGSNNFVNGVVDNIQSVLDQASQVAEKAFGDLNAQLSLEAESRNLAIEMQEFVKQIGTAGEALEKFVARVNGSSTDESPTSQNDLAPNHTGQAPEKPSTTQGKPAEVKPPKLTENPQLYAQAVKNQFNQYLTKTLGQIPGANTGIEAMAAAWYNNQPTQPIISAPTTPQITGDVKAQATELTSELVSRKQYNLQLNQYTTEQQREALFIEADSKIETNKRQIADATRQNARSVLDLKNKLLDAAAQYDYQSADKELAKTLRTIETQFLDVDLDVATQIRNTEDAIESITNLAGKIPGQIARLQSIGTPEALKLAQVKQSGLGELLKALPDLQKNLTKIKDLQADSVQIEADAEAFTKRQGELKIEIESLNKKNNILSVKSNIAATRGTLEAQRKLKVEQEAYRLKLRLAEIELNQAPGKERDDLIESEKQQSKVNTENINTDSLIDELNLEKKLLDLDSGKGEKQAGFLARYGFNLQADKIRRDNAIATENLRFKTELAQIEKDFAGQSDLIAEFTEKARELNRVNLKGIDQQFKSLWTTVQDYGISAIQGFFSNIATNFFDGAAQKEQNLQQERLRYAEELNQLNQQYKDEEGKLAHLKNRARELNEQKLDKINNEFNIFGRVVDLARQALLEFVKQLAVIAAQQAAAKFISSILGSAIGGGGNPAAGAFTASDGITVGEEVPNYSKGDTIKSRKLPNRLTSYFKASPGVKKAFTAEGKGARLGVFHVGEELLSAKTGEAPVYQALKRKYGMNPLQQLVPYFNEGGSVGQIDIGSNILSGLGASKEKIDLSSLNKGRGQQGQSTKIVNLNQTVVTPNADSFNLNQDQRNQDLLESLRRGV